MSLNDRVFSVAIHVGLVLLTAAAVYPLAYVASSSLSSPQAVASGKVFLWPVDLSLEGYRAVFRSPRVFQGYANSLFYTVAGTALNIALTVMAAYPLARRDLPGRRGVMFYLTVTMFFSGGLIPTYLLVRSLGMLDTRLALIIPNAMAVYYVIVARTFFQSSLPVELSEAAEIEGASDMRILIRIALPLSGPLIAVLALFYAVGHWNSYFDALIYLRTPRLHPLQIYLQDVLIKSQADPLMRGASIREAEQTQYLAELVKYALIVVANLPILLLYPFIQRHFVKGVLIGSIKG